MAIPIRWLVSLLGIYACALVYTQRSGMSVAIVAMTSNNDNDNNSNVTVNRNGVTAFQSKKEFDWNESLQGIVLGSQFYLYIVVPTFAGWATDIFGGKWVTFIGTIVPAILSVITPVATRAGGVGALIAIRTIMGGFHGCVYPALFSLYVKWFPARERANANAGLSFGGGLGSTIMYILAGWLCQTNIGWPMVFYGNTLLYIPWLILWIFLCTNDPADNRHVTETELNYIKSNLPKTNMKRKPVKWGKIITSIPVWSSLITKLCCGFGYFLLLQKMPSYLFTVFGIDTFKNGAVSGAATLGQGVFGLIAAPVSNWIIKRFNIRSIIVRKIFQSIAMMGPALCLCMVPVFACNSTGVIAMLIASMMLYGTFTGGEWTVISEYAPNSAGAVFGFANILAFSAGVFSPFLVGLLLDSEEAANQREKWNLIFFITAGIYLFGSIVFILFGTDKQQSWDKDVEYLDDKDDELSQTNDREKA